jgi:hypothetical protein
MFVKYFDRTVGCKIDFPDLPSPQVACHDFEDELDFALRRFAGAVGERAGQS